MVLHAALESCTIRSKYPTRPWSRTVRPDSSIASRHAAASTGSPTSTSPPGMLRLTEPRRPAALDEEDAGTVHHDGPDPDERRRGVLTHGPRPGSRPSRVQASVPYFSATSRSARAASAGERPPGRSGPSTPASPAASAPAISSNPGRRPRTAATVVMPASGSATPGNTARSRPGSVSRSSEPCWRKPPPWAALGTADELSPADRDLVGAGAREAERRGGAGPLAGTSGTTSASTPSMLSPAASPLPRTRYVSSRSSAPGKSPRPRDHAVGQLERLLLAGDRAAAGRSPDQRDPEPGAHAAGSMPSRGWP